jgi:hypothetical protein
MQTLGNECKTEQQNWTQRTFGLFARTSIATLRRRVWPVCCYAYDRWERGEARGGGSETRHFIEKRTYTKVLLVHPPVPDHGQRQRLKGSSDPFHVASEILCRTNPSTRRHAQHLHEKAVNAPRQIRCVRTSPDASVGERMQDRATKLDPTNVWTLCADQCCNSSETCLASPVRGSWR